MASGGGNTIHVRERAMLTVADACTEQDLRISPRQCGRCGIIKPNTRAKTKVYYCIDCRQGDPHYFAYLRETA